MMPQKPPSMTVVVPAHNEELGLARLLPRLLNLADQGEFRIIVVCNGCTDASATEAGKHGPDIEIIELPAPSKAAALAAGGVMVRDFPVAFVDADVSLDAQGLRALIRRVTVDGFLAAAPERHLVRDHVSLPARCYYDIWERLPQVRSGLFGRGVIVLAEAGYRRVAAMPSFISDDLAFSEAFDAKERIVASDCTVSVWPARTWRSLIKRRIRVVQGVQELGEAGRVSPSSSTRPIDLLRIVGVEPRMALRLPLFVLTTLLVRMRVRLGAPARGVWMRDETSRNP
jgi:glycosyltransferase involved in cell wall biosynthesis